ncbi:molecular chaperone, partial [Klebsiella pneumoniae]|nr:hypothetical protein [Klebsiella pneumoniae]MBK3023906.1 hypothetical protein [Klebsiella pneumoniae]MBL3466309.1 molecular chaperone [Klebsiella pneumoniae]
MAITPKTLYFQRLPGRDNSGDRRRTSLLPRDQRPADGFYQELIVGTVAKLAMRQPFVLFKGLTFQKLCL